MEWIAAAFGLVCVILYIRQSIWCWPVGIVQVVLYLEIFIGARLYSDAGLQIVYLGLQIYGWIYWGQPGRAFGAQRPVTRLSATGWFATAGGVAVATVLLGTLADSLGAALPYVDAFATALSLAAQWHIGRKILESWWMWIVVDLVSIGIYLDRELWFTAGLYAVFLALAVAGLTSWQRSSRPQAEIAAIPP